MMKMRNDCLIVLNLCYGVIRDLSIFHCKEAWQVIENIIKLSSQYDNLFIINDLHKKDDVEFKYLPSHMVPISDDLARLSAVEKRLQSKNIQFLTKNTLSPLKNEHIQKLIMAFDNICVSGFTATFDVVPTCIDLITLGKELRVPVNAIDDISDKHKKVALNYLKEFLIVEE
jgi:nicotinamidase-related amidase